MQLNGSDIMMECLLEQGATTIFGYPGGTVINIYDALYKYQDKITHYLTSHEQGAAHAADGFARSTGKVGVCLATSGPGATNLVTGIATAYMDSIPMVALTCNVAASLLGKDTFQEIDITGVTMPITKHNFIVKDVNQLADTMRQAFYIAQEGRPGPVLVDVTKDITSAVTEYTYQAPKPIERKTHTIRTKDIDQALALIAACEKPMVLAGGGVIASGASEALLEFVEKVHAPVALSSMGLGGFPASHPHFLGMVGMHGSRASNLTAMECDLLISIGVRFSDRVTGNTQSFARNAKILHIDVDPAEINKNARATCAVIGDLKAVLDILNQKLTPVKHDAWVQKALDLKATHPFKYANDGKLHSQYVIEKIGQVANGDAIVVTDVGQHQMYACQFINPEKPRHFISSGGLGTMGFGLGASIGASIANPGKKVVTITGDGCFRMNNIELGTAVEYDVPVVVCIINNHALGMVRQWQQIFYDKRYSHTLLNKTTDFVKLAEAHRAKAYNVTKMDEVEPVLREAFALNQTVVINFEVEEEHLVLPMIPAGASIDEFVDEDM